MTERVEVDVCVVGGGFAGLTAAWRLTQAGRSVVVLEARDRVGGRTWTQAREGSVYVDRGGAWLAPRHEAGFRLAAEFGAATYKTYVSGSHLLVDGPQVRRYTGLIPRISPLAVLSIAAAQWRLDLMSRRVRVDRPWASAKARKWDNRSLGSWLARSGVREGIGRELFDMAVRGLFAAPDPEDVSLLDFLFLIRAHGSIEKLFSIEGGAQENLVEGGLGGLAEKVAAKLGDAVVLGSPVRSVTQADGRVTVESERAVVSARHVVVAVPPALAVGIEFDPPLPADRAELYRRAVAGMETKTVLVYDRPFWRDEGLSGQSAHPGSLSEVTIDSSPAGGADGADGAFGALASFAFGSVAEKAASLDPAERRRAVLEALAGRFGPAASSPVDFVETQWWEEPWSRGCSMAHFPPGILTASGHLLRKPFGRVHWAGTETATESHGAVDGAIRSGERVAAELLDRDGR